MKVLGSMLVVVLFALSASAQVLSDPSATPRVAVIQKNWRIEVRNPALERDPLKPNKERQQEEIDLKGDARENENRINQGLPALPPRVRVSAPESGAHGLSVTYIYEVKVRNTGQKPISTITWEYLFFEPGTEREVGRRRFVNKVTIGPGRTRNLSIRSAMPPTGSIDATKAGKKPRDHYSEKIVIQSLAYADGSVWQLASK
jgi:hypothetical protein